MGHPMGSQFRSHIEIENAKQTDHFALCVGEQRISDRTFLGEGAKNLLRVIADRGYLYTVLFEQGSRLFQLDQLGAAVLSPVRAAVEHQQ